jgi:hypothetical protein
MNITIQQAEVITLSEPIIIEAVRDMFLQKKIVAKIKGLPRPITLWDGEEQYTAAGNWTNDTAVARATTVLQLPSIPWA